MFIPGAFVEMVSTGKKNLLWNKYAECCNNGELSASSTRLYNMKYVATFFPFYDIFLINC